VSCSFQWRSHVDSAAHYCFLCIKHLFSLTFGLDLAIQPTCLEGKQEVEFSHPQLVASGTPNLFPKAVTSSVQEQKPLLFGRHCGLSTQKPLEKHNLKMSRDAPEQVSLSKLVIIFPNCLNWPTRHLCPSSSPISHQPGQFQCEFSQMSGR